MWLFPDSFAVLLVVYLVGGVLFMRFVRNGSGVEVIPNSGFWCGFPGYVKVMFLCLHVNGLFVSLHISYLPIDLRLPT